VQSEEPIKHSIFVEIFGRRFLTILRIFRPGMMGDRYCRVFEAEPSGQAEQRHSNIERKTDQKAKASLNFDRVKVSILRHVAAHFLQDFSTRKGQKWPILWD
jgi:hypothetical protein